MGGVAWRRSPFPATFARAEFFEGNLGRKKAIPTDRTHNEEQKILLLIIFIG